MKQLYFWVLFYLIFVTIQKSVIRIGHLLPANPIIAYETDILKLCAKDLRERKILPANITLEVVTMESCRNFIGVANAAYLHHAYNVTVYFGPGCNEEMLVIGRLVSLWNVPIIAHMSGDDALADKTLFSTLGSIALTSATEMARATFTYLKLYNWEKIGVVRPTINFDRLSIHSLMDLVKNTNDMTINVVIEIDPYASADEIFETGKLTTLRNSARIIVVELGMDLNDCSNFMMAVLKAEMNNAEYVYILPWLSHIADYYPWEVLNSNKQQVKQAYQHAIVITAHGYDKKFVQDFGNKFSSETSLLASHYAMLVYMSLYDALFLYGLALRDAYDVTGNEQIYNNGTLIWKKMTNRQFLGMTGQVLTNNDAFRVPSYATYQITNGTLTIVVELEAKLGDPVKCSSKTDCSFYVPHEILTNYWSTANSELPLDIPPCGYDGSLCDNTVYILIGIVSLATVTIFAVGYLLYVKEQERRLHDMTWRIPRDSVRMLDLATARSRKSLDGISLCSMESKINSKLSVKQAICNGVKLSVRRFAQTRNITFMKSELQILKQLKMVENENLNKFYGICFNQKNELLILWVLVTRGSLEDVIFNEDMKLGRNFQVSFAKDVVKGIYFLHNSPLQYHGLLCLQNCLVDSNWTIKLSDFCTEIIIADKLLHNEIKKIHVEKDENDETHNISRSNSDDTFIFLSLICFNTISRSFVFAEYIQQAPEILRSLLQTNFLPHGSQAADMYALGMVLYQILFRMEPFSNFSLPKKKLLHKLANGVEEDYIRPAFPSAGHDPGFSLQLLKTIEVI
ncbi:unnamed protein product [Thelazia callipaeda]|uniref:guanylate cyclase n=1 Tax=Thelazia callipaeda TaxID=103827 RepID=A0A0N5CMK9_THECL|nr:unnamed protein product [Thelazia callipaeda]